jgi:glycerate kinase
MSNGFSLVADAVDLSRRLRRADFVITAEGTIEADRGKVRP